MQRRQGTVEVFSTFIQFDTDKFNGWVTDAKLRRSMKTCLEKSSRQDSYSFWALYWYKAWEKSANASEQDAPNYSSLAYSHLCAYLQEVCYWAARKSALNSSGHSSISDFFQIAIAQVGKILKAFNPEQSSHLKSYAELSFERIIRDVLRVRREADVCSDVALLHKVSRRRLIKSLQNMGLSQENIANYVLAWECFEELYTSGNTEIRQRRKPDKADWEAITKLYNAQRLTRGLSSGAVNSQTIEKWLGESAKAIRNFLYPKFVSADTPLKDDGDAILLDILPGNVQDSLLAQMVEQEESASLETQQTQLNEVLNQAIAALDSKSRQLLQVYYSQQFTQTEIAKQLEIKQYKVSRLLSSIRKSLLLTLTQWSQNTLHISPTSVVIASINISLEEWLKFHYSQTEQG
ncbi:RNA polymerase sigma factor, sigma-70 family [Rivularia sp. PCC 7116]|uniref:sigma-70 family RNA polymerase sigma factor n=1 Tax=Rivularia sp. PCC 7116 TaxID=373994 RepID=UPI00029EC648|nr:sigma-70 family RNA polymerase sigma factor [Rivularia sp. PCC 7116]AFY55443.1 RNA polymerase sigma factor, sigma-70 family [Rivularia sp. PCC 7116]